MVIKATKSWIWHQWGISLVWFSSNAIFVEKQQWYYLTASCRDKELPTFPENAYYSATEVRTN